MNRRIVITVCLLLFITFMSPSPLSAQTMTKQQAVAAAQAHFQNQPKLLAPLSMTDYQLTRAQVDDGGNFHLIFTQFHLGYPVRGQTLTVHIGANASVTHFHLSDTPTRLRVRQPRKTRSVAQFRQQATSRMKGPTRDARPARYVWTRDASQQWQLGWEVTAISKQRRLDVRTLIYDTRTGALLHEKRHIKYGDMPFTKDECSTQTYEWENIIYYDRPKHTLVGCGPGLNDFRLIHHNYNFATFSSDEIATDSLFDENLQLVTHDFIDDTIWDYPDDFSYSALLSSESEDDKAYLDAVLQALEHVATHTNVAKVLHVMTTKLNHHGYDDQWSPLTVIPNVEASNEYWAGRTTGFGTMAFARDYAKTGYGHNLGTLGHEIFHNIEESFYEGIMPGGFCEDPQTNGMEEGVSSAFGNAVSAFVKYGQTTPTIIYGPMTTLSEHTKAWNDLEKFEDNFCKIHDYGLLVELFGNVLTQGLVGSTDNSSAFLIAPIGPLKVAYLFLRMVKYNYPWRSYAKLAEGLLQSCFDSVGYTVGNTTEEITTKDCTMVEYTLQLAGLTPPNAKGVTVEPFYLPGPNISIQQIKFDNFWPEVSGLHKVEAHSRYNVTLSQDGGSAWEKLGFKLTRTLSPQPQHTQVIKRAQPQLGGNFISARSISRFIPYNKEKTSVIKLTAPVLSFLEPPFSMQVEAMPLGTAGYESSGDSKTIMIGADYELAGSKVDIAPGSLFIDKLPAQFIVHAVIRNTGTRPIMDQLPVKIATSLEKTNKESPSQDRDATAINPSDQQALLGRKLSAEKYKVPRTKKFLVPFTSLLGKVLKPGKIFELPPITITAVPGATVYLIVDPNNLLPELDETNNVFAIQLPKTHPITTIPSTRVPYRGTPQPKKSFQEDKSWIEKMNVPKEFFAPPPKTGPLPDQGPNPGPDP